MVTDLSGVDITMISFTQSKPNFVTNVDKIVITQNTENLRTSMASSLNRIMKFVN